MKLLKSGKYLTVELNQNLALDLRMVQLIMSHLGLGSATPTIGDATATIEHQWDGTKLRIRNPDGTWGEWVNLRGEPGEMGFDGKNGIDGWDGQDGIDGDIPEHQWDGTKIRFRQPSGQWGQYVELGDIILRSQEFFGTSGNIELSPQHKLYQQTKVSKWEPVKASNQYSEGSLFFRTIGEKLLNIRGTTKATVPLQPGAAVGIISRRDAGVIHYGIEPSSLAEIHCCCYGDRYMKHLVIDSKHQIRCLDRVQQFETLHLDLLIGR